MKNRWRKEKGIEENVLEGRRWRRRRKKVRNQCVLYTKGGRKKEKIREIESCLCCRKEKEREERSLSSCLTWFDLHLIPILIRFLSASTRGCRFSMTCPCLASSFIPCVLTYFLSFSSPLFLSLLFLSPQTQNEIVSLSLVRRIHWRWQEYSNKRIKNNILFPFLLSSFKPLKKRKVANHKKMSQAHKKLKVCLTSLEFSIARKSSLTQFYHICQHVWNVFYGRWIYLLNSVMGINIWGTHSFPLSLIQVILNRLSFETET